MQEETLRHTTQRGNTYTIDLVDDLPQSQRKPKANSLIDELKSLASRNPESWIRIDITDNVGNSGLISPLKRKGFQATTRKQGKRTYLFVHS